MLARFVVVIVVLGRRNGPRAARSPFGPRWADVSIVAPRKGRWRRRSGGLGRGIRSGWQPVLLLEREGVGCVGRRRPWTGRGLGRDRDGCTALGAEQLLAGGGIRRFEAGATRGAGDGDGHLTPWGKNNCRRRLARTTHARRSLLGVRFGASGKRRRMQREECTLGGGWGATKMCQRKRRAHGARWPGCRRRVPESISPGEVYPRSPRRPAGPCGGPTGTCRPMPTRRQSTRLRRKALPT